jgi:hypothetical protein
MSWWEVVQKLTLAGVLAASASIHCSCIVGPCNVQLSHVCSAHMISKGNKPQNSGARGACSLHYKACLIVTTACMYSCFKFCPLI